MSSNARPDFIIVGAAKAGTTSVFEYLGEHPQVFITTPKETDFFAYQVYGESERYMHGVNQRAQEMVIRTPEAYRALFAGASATQVCGEASPSYMLDARIPALIHAWNPAVKIVMLLRDPAERAWSDFLHNQLYGSEVLPPDRFREAFEDSGRRLAEGWRMNANYEIKGRYGEQLERFLAVLPREQIGVFFYDDLKKDPQAFMRDLYAFIGVDAAFTPRTEQRYNVNGVPAKGFIKRTLYRFLYQPHAIKRVLRHFVPASVRRRLRFGLQWRVLERPPVLPPDVRAELAAHYLADIEKLELLTGRDLHGWKSAAAHAAPVAGGAGGAR